MLIYCEYYMYTYVVYTVHVARVCIYMYMYTCVYICIVYVLSLTQEPGRPKSFGLSGSRVRESLLASLKTIHRPLLPAYI